MPSDIREGLSRDSAGNLYGNTVLGGTYNGGTVFKYDALGNERVLHSFSGADGEYPGGALVLNPTVSGIVVYGTTQQGGADGSGAVFEIVAPLLGLKRYARWARFASIAFAVSRIVNTRRSDAD